MSNKKILQENTVMSMKLVSGEEIVGKITSWDDAYYYVHAPLGVMMNHQGALQLMPALFTSDQNPDAMLPRTCVTMMAEARAEVEQAYVKSVTGLDVPSKQILTG